jgi:uncharacterized protein (DUF885 family)
MTGADDLLDGWVRDELDRSPTLADGLGVGGYAGVLDDLSRARWEAGPAEDRRWAGAIDALDLTAQTLDEQVDLLAVLTRLAGRQVMEDWLAWQRDPSLYLRPCLTGIHTGWLHRLRTDAELTESTVALLREVPRAMAEARANLAVELMPPLFAARGAAQARSGARYLLDGLPAETDDPTLRARLAEEAAAAAAALDGFAGWLTEVGPGARGDWAIGEARYSALLRERELLGVDAAVLHQRGRVAYEELAAEMAEVAAEIDPASPSFTEVLAALDADCPDSPETMRDGYARSCLEARRFLSDRGLVTLPEGESCLVVPAPGFERPLLAVASYQQAPPFSASRVGHFFVPYPPDGESAEGVRQRLANNGWHAIPTTAVHEAYPGHHWHLSWSASTPRPVRKLVRTSYFVEGWALYAERMMREQGFFADSRQVLSHLGARIFRAARVVVDTALHCGDMTPEQAALYLQERTATPPTVARAEVERYCSWPTQAASYLTGSLQIEALRERWHEEGRGSLREFHDAVAANPGLPVALVERLLFPVPATSPSGDDTGRPL